MLHASDVKHFQQCLATFASLGKVVLYTLITIQLSKFERGLLLRDCTLSSVPLMFALNFNNKYKINHICAAKTQCRFGGFMRKTKYKYFTFPRKIFIFRKRMKSILWELLDMKPLVVSLFDLCGSMFEFQQPILFRWAVHNQATVLPCVQGRSRFWITFDMYIQSVLYSLSISVQKL